MGLESLSEPDDLDMDMDEEEEDGEQFFDTRSQSASTSSGGGRDQGPNKSDELDTEEDPVDPITPGPGVRSFEPRAVEKENEPGGVVVVVESDGVVEDDDWVDPSLPSPVAPPPMARSLVGPQQRSPPGSIDLPAFAKGKSALGKKGKKPSKRSRSGSGAVVVKTPVPPVRPHDPQDQLDQQHSSFPFPMTQKSADDVPTSLPEERPRGSSVLKGKRMHTAKARDGGRTQSGGVKGVLPTSDD